MFYTTGSLQLTILLSILSVLSIFIAINLLSNTKKLEFWKDETELDEFMETRIPRMSRLVERAFEGKRLSRNLFENKLKKDFLIKVKDEKNLTKTQINYLLNYPSKLENIIGDKMIVDFITSQESLDDVISKEFEKISKSDYKKKIEKLLKKMEEWP
ncbi:MAG: hypothetical protein ACOC85_00630 [Thermoplasmatota archaeon]